jgi:hypothetical protein
MLYMANTRKLPINNANTRRKGCRLSLTKYMFITLKNCWLKILAHGLITQTHTALKKAQRPVMLAPYVCHGTAAQSAKTTKEQGVTAEECFMLNQ